MKIYVVNKELSSAHGTTAVVLQFQGVMVYMRPVEMNTNKKAITGRHFVCACAKTRLIPSPNSIFTRSDKNTNFGAIFSHFTLKYLCQTIHKLTGKGGKLLETNCTFKIGCGIKYIFAGKTRNIWMLT